MLALSQLATLERKLKGKESSVEELIQAKEELLKFAKKTISTLEANVADLQTRSGLFGFNLPSIRDALCQDFQAGKRYWCPTKIGTIGEGPWQEGDFDRFLRDRQFKPTKPPRTTIDSLVVGMGGWSDEVLSQQLVGKNTHSLRIYTQELFVFGIILGRDPYDVLEQDVIDEVADYHPAIQFILQTGFSWPWRLEEDIPVPIFLRNLTPSAALALVVGPNPLRRSEAEKRLWNYIKKNKLQDRVNKRVINADEKLKEIFGKPQVSIFELVGVIRRHLK